MLGEQIQKMAAARAAAVQGQMMTRTVAEATAAAPAAGAATAAAAPAAAAREQAFDAARFAGIFAAIGLAIGAIGTAIASIVTGFLNLSWWQMPLAVAGLILAISGPSMLIAALKLRSRNLGPILDASGWAVNTRLRVNIPFGSALTAVARLPAGAQRSLTDPYAEKKQPWALYGALAASLAIVVALWWYGVFAYWLRLLH
jgi:MFS family permease